MVKWWDDTIDEIRTYNLRYKYENNGWNFVTLKNIYQHISLNEKRAAQNILNPLSGRYICQIQSQCDFGESKYSEEIGVNKKEEVS